MSRFLTDRYTIHVIIRHRVFLRMAVGCMCVCVCVCVEEPRVRKTCPGVLNTHPLPTSILSASRCPLNAAHIVGVIPSSSLALQSRFVASFSMSKKPS